MHMGCAECDCVIENEQRVIACEGDCCCAHLPRA